MEIEEIDLTPISSLFEGFDDETETPNADKADGVDKPDADIDADASGDIVAIDDDTSKDGISNDNDSDKNTEEGTNDEDVSIDSVKTFYNYWKEILPIDELEDGSEPTLDFLREQQDKLPEKYFLGYVESRPDFIQEFLTYQADFENPTVDDLKGFWDNYVANDKNEVANIESNDDARSYLKSRPEFTKIYSGDSIDGALDLLEDNDSLVDTAKKLQTEEIAEVDARKKEVLKKAEDERASRQHNEKEFANSVRQTLNGLQWQDTRKNKVLNEMNAGNISKKWNEIVGNPKAFVQFADFLSYFNGEDFDKFYTLIEGKKDSVKTSQKKAGIERDSLGKLLGSTKPKERGKYRSVSEDFG